MGYSVITCSKPSIDDLGKAMSLFFGKQVLLINGRSKNASNLKISYLFLVVHFKNRGQSGPILTSKNRGPSDIFQTNIQLLYYN